VLTGHAQLISSIPVSENGYSFTNVERLPEANVICRHQCWAELKQDSESVSTHADAMAATDAAIDGFADAARRLSRLQSAGFLLRPSQLRAAANIKGTADPGAHVYLTGRHHIHDVTC
jgi:hypothetical protein